MAEIVLMVPLPALLKAPPDIPDLGLGYIASATRNRGFDIAILDWNSSLSPDAFKRYLHEHKPKLVGIKVFTVNMKAAQGTANMIKEAAPDTIVVVGGPHPSTCDPEDIFEEFPRIDFAFCGEVEESFPRFIELLKSVDFDRSRFGEISARFDSISGLLWRDGSVVRSNPPSLDDIDSFAPPAWDLINPNDYSHPPLEPSSDGKNLHVAPIIATRGCPFDCTFCCAYHINGKHIRRRGVNDLVDEIETHCNSHGVHQFLIMDAAFVLDTKYVLEFCDEILKRGLEIRWDCILEILGNYSGVDKDVLFEKMYRAGCRQMVFGIETASPKIRELVKKNCDLEQLRQTIRLVRKHNIKAFGFFMFGFPEETLEDMQLTVEFGLREPFDMVSFGVCLPLPGTEIYTDLKKQHGFKRIDWSTYSTHATPYRIGKVSSARINKTLCLANLRAHLKRNRGIKGILSKETLKWLAKYALNR